MSIPRQNSRWVDENGQPTREFYDWARRLSAPEAEASISIGSLSNVTIGTPLDGHLLAYNATADQWLNGYPTQLQFTPTSTPLSPTAGLVYYDSGTNKLRCYNGTIWNDLF